MKYPLKYPQVMLRQQTLLLMLLMSTMSLYITYITI